MTDTQTNPVTLDEIQWSENFVVSMKVTDAPGIKISCGHDIQPQALILVFTRGSLEGWSPVTELSEWKIMGFHAHGEDGGYEVTLTEDDFSTGPMPLPGGLEAMAGPLEAVSGTPRPDLLGEVPEWVHTAIKSYRPQVERYIPVRTEATYHG